MFVLDASALLRFLLRQAGGERVLEILRLGQEQKARLLISAVNWGEVVARIDKAEGRASAEALAATLIYYGLEIISANRSRAERAALLRRDWDIGYADAFCVELALYDSQTSVITADFGFRKTESLVKTEFLPEDPTYRAKLP